MRKTKVVTTEDILLKLCQSVTAVLSKATDSSVHHSAMVQKITKTSLKPDFGCFVLFDGGFSGLVVINFDAKSALELYKKYMSHMGMPEEELATLHTSDEVADVLGELMNQIVGDFTGKVKRSLQTNITQNQPKMMAINKNINVTIDSNIERPQARRVSFSTEDNNIFYLELAMERTEFIQLEEFEEAEEINPDAILETEVAKKLNGKDAKSAKKQPVDETDSLMDDLGI
ncbi:DUF3334 family protein [Enterovibrio makurazakiensis]|uniref:DUF3334 family protein n=1 Tax=Enterovibrio gelatinilyticus TaxID=2899819 RepID=A0ABT5QUK6_9GAMM|nr:DUF3334 family protein [Enterovibrio sp. ZSDZ42]MDD1791683.1 DUF3334 family protein [Enterovibrio sp. ZSDZ42]